MCMVCHVRSLKNRISDVALGFDPTDVFAVHYQRTLARSVGNLHLSSGDESRATIMLGTGFARLVEQHFKERSESYGLQVRVFTDVMNEFRGWLAPLKTYKACLGCLINASPEHKLPCKHMLCEDCCVKLGKRSEKDPSLYRIDACPICAVECEFLVRIRPATAGFRVLCLDGGGIRAEVGLQFLIALEREIGIDMPVQENFQFAYGTSSGKPPTCAILLPLTPVIRITCQSGPVSTRFNGQRCRSLVYRAGNACFSWPGRLRQLFASSVSFMLQRAFSRN